MPKITMSKIGMKSIIILGIYSFIFIFVIIPILYILLLNFYVFIWLGIYFAFFVAVIFVIASISYFFEIYKQFEKKLEDMENFSEKFSK